MAPDHPHLPHTATPTWRTVLFILLTTWGWALLFQLFFSVDPCPPGDPSTFDWLARNLLDNGQLSEPDSGYRSWRAPGYTAFVAGIYAILGRNPVFVVIVQYGLVGLSAVLLFITSYRLWANRPLSYLFFAFFLLYIPTFYYAGILYAETLFLTVVSAAIWRAVPLLQHPHNQWSKALSTGILVGLAILTRTALLYFPLFALGIGLFIFLTARLFRHPIHLPPHLYKKMTGLVIGMILIVAPWTVRNYAIHGQFLATGSYGGYNLYMAQYPLQTYTHWPGRIPAELWPEITQNIDAVRHKHSEVEQDRILSQKAVEIIKKYPFRFIKKGAKEFIRFYTKAGAYGQGFIAYLSAIQYLGLVLLSVWGIYLSRHDVLGILLGTYIAYFGLIHAMTFAMGRLKEAIVPAILLLSALGAYDLCCRIFKKWGFPSIVSQDKSAYS